MKLLLLPVEISSRFRSPQQSASCRDDSKEHLAVRTLTLWDSGSDPSRVSGLFYRWNGYAESDSIQCLLTYVEAHGERLRRKYLAWIHDQGECRIDGKRLIDHLVLDNGLSYWWLTLLAEKSPWKSPAIVDAIRLLALEEVLLEEKPGTFLLVSANCCLHEVLRDLCQNLGIVYEWERLSAPPRPQLSCRGIYQALPPSVSALIRLAHYVLTRWPFRQAEKSGWFGGAKSLFVCSFLYNVDSSSAKAGEFHSRLWEGLPRVIAQSGYPAGNWLHLFTPHAAISSPRVAMDWVQRFNLQRQEQGFHAFLDAYLSWPVVWRVCKHWVRLSAAFGRLRGIKQGFRPEGSQLSLWPIFRGDWRDSMRGSSSISNLLWIELFDRALRDLPHQDKGLYLCENQPWERALIHAWRNHGHGQLIAVAHSTMRFWDLRYFIDPRTVRSSAPYSMPQPDYTALNGQAAVEAYLATDYPKEAIVECEALRYGYLSNLSPWHSSRKVAEAPIRVLILGDYLASGTIKMLQLLETAASRISVPATYTVKPHPNYAVRAADYPSLHLSVVMDSLGDIMPSFDVAYSSNMTSAAVDAYLAGLPVVVGLDEAGLNLSPLRGLPDVPFVETAAELAEALQAMSRGLTGKPNCEDFFFLDPELPRWTRILSAVTLA